MKKRIISLALALVMCLSLCVPTFAIKTGQKQAALISGVTSTSYSTDDGTHIEKVTFWENSEFSAIIKRTYNDGSFDVEAINGEKSVLFKGVVAAQNDLSSLIPGSSYTTTAITYPHYTPYWYAGYDDYSQNGVALTVAIIAGLLVANTGLGSSAAVTVASSIYTALGSNIYSNVYFRTYRYYATLEYEAGVAPVWYNKFVTYTYSDSARKNILTGPDTEIYESMSPM